MQREPNRNDKNFTEDIIESVEVSMLESSSQEPALGNGNSGRDSSEKNFEAVKKRKFFNLLLIGAASTGKTTFM